MTWVLKMLYYPIKIDKNRKQLVYNKRLFNSYFLKKTNRLVKILVQHLVMSNTLSKKRFPFLAKAK